LGYLDLHIHTTVSDGTLTPREVVRYAKGKGLKVIAITDHDSIEGNKEALDEGTTVGLSVVPGFEISAECPHGVMHLLGYGIDLESSFLKERLEFLQRVREERNSKILDKLKDLGLALDHDDILKLAGGGQIGRLHFAKAIVEQGYAAERKEAFDRFLKKGRPAYADRFRLKPEDAIGLVLKSKGLPVLAHPCMLNNLGPADLDNFITELVKLGLKGIEAYYPNHTDEQAAYYRYLADKYGILATGGSDYHGANKPEVEIGVFTGDTKLSFSLLEAMAEFWG